jgi:RNA polymerase sigma-70 factor (ECF subfamily)
MVRRAPAESDLSHDRTERAAHPDERAAVAAAQRDPARFDALYEANFERVYAYVARRIRDRDDARDLTAEVFHRALRNLPRFEWRGVPFAGWLMRIAANAIADRAERAAREAPLDAGTIPETRDDGGVENDDFEARARLFRLVDALPSEQRRVIVLRFAEHRSIREIATAIEKSEGAVKQLQFRALATLRMRLGESRG